MLPARLVAEGEASRSCWEVAIDCEYLSYQDFLEGEEELEEASQAKQGATPTEGLRQECPAIGKGPHHVVHLHPH